LPVRERVRAMAVILTGIGLSVLDVSIVNIALPAIAHEFRVDPAQSVWVVNAYQLAVLSLLLPFAALGERLGYRRVYLAGLALFALASAGCMLAGSLQALSAARAIQGVGAAAVMSVNSAMVRLVFPSGQLGRGLALNSVVVAAATAAGPSVGAAILSLASWPFLFALNVPIGLLLLPLGWRALPHNPPRTHAPSRIGPLDVLLNAAMFSLLFIGVDTLAAGWRPSGTQGSTVTGVACIVAAFAVGAVHLRRERGKSTPLFPVDLLRNRLFALSLCSSVSAFSAQTLATIALPFLMLGRWGLSPAQAGVAMTAWPLGLIAAAPFVARLIGRLPGGLLGGIGMGVMATGLLLVALLPDRPELSNVAWRLAVCGIGFGLFQSPNNHIIVTSAPLGRSGAASGMLGTARLTGQSAGAVGVAAIFGIAPVADGTGPTAAIAIAAVVALAAAGVSLLRLREGR
jgi:DHA2 family multidrug resistance protein-like MFS transporter